METGGKTDPNGNHWLYDGAFYIDQTPPEVSLENYKIYLKLFKEYVEK